MTAKIGDRVTFRFADGFKISGVIKGLPADEGSANCWVIKEYWEGNAGNTVYINQFETMRLHDDRHKR